MKRLILSLLLVFLISSASAISTDLQDSYSKSETVILKLSGEINQVLSPQDVILKRNHVAIAFDYDLKRVGNNYYIYFISPNQENNYTLFINSLGYNKTFSITNETIDYNIKPGFFITSKDLDFTINLKKDEEEIISIDLPSEIETTLLPGDNKIKLSYNSFAPGFYEVNIGRYKIPIYILGQNTQTNSQEIVNLSIYPREIQSVLFSNQKRNFPFQITNSLDETISGLFFEYNTDLMEIKPSTIGILEPQQTKYFNLTLISSINFNEIVSIKSQNSHTEFSVNINYTSNSSEVSTPYLDSGSEQYCSELGGFFCSADEICSIDSINSLDGPCCTGICKSPSQSSNYSWVGYSIGILLLIIGIWLSIKYKKSKSLEKKVNPLEKAIKKTSS